MTLAGANSAEHQDSKLGILFRKAFGLDSSKQSLSFRQLYTYASRRALSFTFLGALASLLNSVLMPITCVLYGQTTDSFVSDKLCPLLDYLNISAICPPGIDSTNFNEQYFRCNFTGTGIEVPKYDIVGLISAQLVYFVLIGLATLVLTAIQISAFSYACEIIILELRKRVIRAMLSFPIEWFDVNDAGVVSSYLVENMNKVKNGVGDKLGIILQAIGTMIAALVVGFVYNWELSLITLATSPLVVIASALTTIVTTRSGQTESAAYARAGSVAQQAIQNIRTVQAFNGQRTMKSKYRSNLDVAKREGIKKTAVNGLMLSTLWMVVFGAHALCFWYGGRMVNSNQTTVGVLLTVFMSIHTAVFTVGNAIPHVTATNEARAAAYQLYELINSPNESDLGHIACDHSGKDIVFDRVSFAYPTRPDCRVLNDFSLRIPEGKTTALVGESGSGKSTIVQLLLRFYHQQQSGTIRIGDERIEHLELGSYRRALGFVSQEPVLFSASIADNIRLGRPEATNEQIEELCAMANAAEFIEKLPNRYETFVGESGSTLSGGQKQRIAIARALANDPRILILDEATSALDSESERCVQEALEKASRGRTTIVIAHRLSTIRNADLIVGIEAGRVAEIGTHEQLLMQKDGIYSKLVKANQKQTDDADHQYEAKTIAERTQSAATISSGQKHSPNDTDQSDFDKRASLMSSKGVTRFMFKMNMPELGYIILGCLACAIFGLIQTLFELYFAILVVEFSNCDLERRTQRVNGISFLFFIFGIVSMVAQIISSVSFGISGENLTKRLRLAIFDLYMRNDISFFDRFDHSVGSLCTTLSSEASSVQGATGVRIGVVISNFFILGTGIVISLIYGWELTLVFVAFIPLIVISGILSIKLMGGFDAKDKKYLEKAGRVAVEATLNIRTVKQLNLENHFSDQYIAVLEEAFTKNSKKSLTTGILFGISMAVIFFAFAAGYYAGARFVELGRMSTKAVMIVFGGMIFAAMALGQNQAMAPEHGKSSAAAAKIFEMLKEEPLLDSMSAQGLCPETFKGSFEFSDVSFTYPTRESVSVLRNVNLRIEGGSHIALVGPSGSGKSTFIQLLERYYDPSSGRITLDGLDVRDINIQWYRRQLGLVGQEPILFDWSIADNIKFGDSSRNDITIEEVRAAAKQSNIDDFVCGLPDGYETRVGAKGSLVSGGQKQRICIARSLIRNPKLLLLDEATSALDAESEKHVQEAIDNAQKGRGSLTIAHKLKTIQNSETIHVLEGGVVVESGRHQELLETHGLYSELYDLSAAI